MIRLSLSAICFFALLATTVVAQGTYGTGRLPNKPPRLSEKEKTTAIVLEVYTNNHMIKVKDEITNAETVYKVATNAEISGNKKEFGKENLKLEDVPKGRRIKLIYYKHAPNIAQEIEVLKEKK